jgi:hypothetical protein
MRGQDVLTLRDFSGGLNLRDAPLDLADNESPAVVDFQPVGDQGAIQRRVGDLISGLDWGPSAGGAPGMLLSRKLSDLLIPTSDGALTDGTASILEGVPVGALNGQYAFAEMPAVGGQGPVFYLTPGTPRVPRYWDGATNGNWTASTGTLPLAHYLCTAGNRVWAARTDADPDAVYWSNLGDARDWPAANVTRFGVGDGEVITGIAAVDSYVIVFKESRAWLIYDLDTSANRPLGPYGNSAYQMHETPYGLVFLDPRRGVSITNGGSVDPIGWKLGSDVVAYDFTFLDDSLYMAAQVGAGTGIYEYRFRTKSWWRHTLPSARSITEFAGLLLATRDGGRRYYTLMSTGSTDYLGATLTPSWRSKPFTPAGSHVAKRLRSAELVGEGTLTVVGRKDFLDAAAFTRGPFTLPTANQSNRQRMTDLGMAYALSLEIQGTGTDLQRIDELSIHTTTRRD